MHSRRWLAALALSALLAPPVAAQASLTLRDVLRESRIPPGGLPARDLDQTITSFASSDSTDAFILAYYPKTLRGAAGGDSLRIAAYDKRSAAWHQVAIARGRMPARNNDPPLYLGSVLDIHRSPTRLYIDTHVNPSAGIVLVLDRNLNPITTLYGWILRVLPNDVVVYHRSTIHFAPTHSAEIWTYDAHSRRDAILYPRPPFDSVRRAFAEPFDSALQDSVVVSRDSRSLAFIDVFGDAQKTPTEVAVVCRDAATPEARCSETPLSVLARRNPGSTNAQILASLLAAR